jgi:hypothetical protein
LRLASNQSLLLFTAKSLRNWGKVGEICIKILKKFEPDLKIIAFHFLDKAPQLNF